MMEGPTRAIEREAHLVLVPLLDRIRWQESEGTLDRARSVLVSPGFCQRSAEGVKAVRRLS